MTALRDISIRTKLSAGFGLALSLVVAIGLIGVLQLRANNKFATMLAETTMQEIALLGEVRGAMAEHRLLAERRIETTNFHQLAEIADAMDIAGDTLLADATAYAAIADSAEERGHYAHFVKDWTDYEKSLASVLRRLEIGEIEQGSKQFEMETLVALGYAIGHVDELLAISKREGVEAIDQARAIYVTFLSVTVVTILVGLVSMSGGILWVVRSISQPILRVSDAMRRLTAGDASATLDEVSDRKDEIGTLIAAAGGYRNSLVTSRRLAKEAEEERQRMDAAINNMPIGLCMFDAEMRLIVANAPYAEMYGLPDEVTRPGTPLETIVDYRIANGHFAGEDPVKFRNEILKIPSGRETVKKIWHFADGRIISATLRPMTSGGWVATHEDVTAQHQAEQVIARLAEEAELESQRLDAAISNMPIGLSMFDAEKRLIVANARYGEMYRLADDLLQPGTPLETILDYRINAGHFDGDDPVKFREDILAVGDRRETRRDVRHFPDGSIFSVIVQPMRGGGWVSTHEDVTAQHEAEQKIVRLGEEAELERQRLDAAMSNMPIGVSMFDAQKRLITSNSRYAEIYQLPPELTQPGTEMRAILEQRARAGNYAGNDPAKYFDELTNMIDRREPSREIRQFHDGRTLSIIYQPMEGGGWVATHEDITERQKAETKIAYMARYDALTDLPNRVLFRERIGDAIAHETEDEGVAILCLDLDHFKRVNDTLGHPTGDKLLRIVAERLRECVREPDTVARLSGDEFAVVQVGAGQPQGAHALAQRIIEKLSAPYVIDGDSAVIGASIGIAIAPADGKDADQLLKNADMALYRAKADGRGLYRFFEPEMDALMQARRALELDLRKALDRQEFELFYQPLINLKSDRITGFEALLRWRHPERGMVSPVEFIPLAEETGLIVPIGEWVLKQACKDAASWPGKITVAVNLSAVQFRSARLMQSVVGALDVSRLPPTRLELEITESVLLAETEGTLAVLHQFRALGAHISMDDFGTGYSSLSYLQSFPFDKIKIDRRFIKDIAEDGNSLAIIRAVTGLSASLGIGTTAEGVETVDQLDRVRFEGCTEVQGYLLGRPMPAADALALLDGQPVRAATAA